MRIELWFDDQKASTKMVCGERLRGQKDHIRVKVVGDGNMLALASAKSRVSTLPKESGWIFD